MNTIEVRGLDGRMATLRADRIHSIHYAGPVVEIVCDRCTLFCTDAYVDVVQRWKDAMRLFPMWPSAKSDPGKAAEPAMDQGASPC